MDRHFTSPDELVSVSVNGRLSRHVIVRAQRVNGSNRVDGASSDPLPNGLRTIWTAQATSCVKVDALAFGEQRFAIAGLHRDQKRGAVELWDVESGELDENRDCALTSS